jgi:hypothetical protein
MSFSGRDADKKNEKTATPNQDESLNTPDEKLSAFNTDNSTIQQPSNIPHEWLFSLDQSQAEEKAVLDALHITEKEQFKQPSAEKKIFLDILEMRQFAESRLLRRKRLSELAKLHEEVKSITIAIEKYMDTKIKQLKGSHYDEAQDSIINYFQGPTRKRGYTLDFGASLSELIVATIYFDRYLEKMTSHAFEKMNGHQLAFISFLLAQIELETSEKKSHKTYADFLKLKPAELTNLQSHFLVALDYRLHVDVETCKQYEKELLGKILARTSNEKLPEQEKENLRAMMTAITLPLSNSDERKMINKNLLIKIIEEEINLLRKRDIALSSEMQLKIKPIQTALEYTAFYYQKYETVNIDEFMSVQLCGPTLKAALAKSNLYDNLNKKVIEVLDKKENNHPILRSSN